MKLKSTDSIKRLSDSDREEITNALDLQIPTRVTETNALDGTGKNSIWQKFTGHMKKEHKFNVNTPSRGHAALFSMYWVYSLQCETCREFHILLKEMYYLTC